jgi:hypothetical protein
MKTKDNVRMTLKDVEKLRSGDKIRYSRTLTISNIKVIGEIVRIVDWDGVYLECLVNELEIL